jgi:hypothetical protein
VTYVKQAWANGSAGGTPITAERLGYIETGVDVAHDLAEAAQADADLAQTAAAAAQTDADAAAAAAAAAQADADTAAAAAGAAIPRTADIQNIVKITQAAYDALTPPVASTLYIIQG